MQKKKKLYWDIEVQTASINNKYNFKSNRQQAAGRFDTDKSEEYGQVCSPVNKQESFCKALSRTAGMFS